MNLDRKYLVWAFGYALAGMCLGIYMAATKNHGQLVAHAHILLVGFVVSFIYAIIHRLWLDKPNPAVGKSQFVLHHVATIAMFSGLVLLYGGVLPEPLLEPVLGIASVGVLVAAALMLYMLIKSGPAQS